MNFIVDSKFKGVRRYRINAGPGKLVREDKPKQLKRAVYFTLIGQGLWLGKKAWHPALKITATQPNEDLSQIFWQVFFELIFQTCPWKTSQGSLKIYQGVF